MKKEHEIIKETILKIAKKHGIDVEKIILFGSRARGESRKSGSYGSYRYLG